MAVAFLSFRSDLLQNIVSSAHKCEELHPSRIFQLSEAAKRSAVLLSGEPLAERGKFVQVPKSYLLHLTSRSVFLLLTGIGGLLNINDHHLNLLDKFHPVDESIVSSSLSPAAEQ